jgi:hypothetical protein
MSTNLERIEAALGSMSFRGPKDLNEYLAQPAPDFEKFSKAQVEIILDSLLSGDPNGTAQLRFSGLMREWDNSKEPSWGDETSRNTLERRSRIYQLLRLADNRTVQVDELIPFYRIEEPLVIAEKPDDWYEPKTGIRDYYWQTYKSYLQHKKHWKERSIISLDNDTRSILERLRILRLTKPMPRVD